MKKFIAIALAALTVFSFSTVALAADTTTLTTTVPDATYTLNIPADQQIAFGATSTDIGNISVTEASGFAISKNIDVTITYNAFTSSDVSTKIPFVIVPNVLGGGAPGEINSGDILTFWGESDGGVSKYPGRRTSRGLEISGLKVNINGSDWGKALGGEYSSTLTFTADVVSGS